LIARAFAFCLLLGALPAVSQEATPPDNPDAKPADPVGPAFRGETDVAPTSTITFKFEDARQQPARYQIVLHANGVGHFNSQVGPAQPTDIAQLPPENQDRDIIVADKTRASIFLVARKEHGFAIKCESGGNKIAFQGTKTVSYDGPDAHGTCSFNYSSDAKLQWLVAEMEGIATTLEEGRRLTMEHVHGRLTLDAELGNLETLVKEGQATEIENIAPVLQAIIVDENVITRARRRAQALLDTAPLLPAPK